MIARKRVGILISGRGSNMVALLKAMAAPDFPAEPVLVLSNRADAAGLVTAADNGVPTAVEDHRPYKGDRESFDRAMNARVEAAGVEIICLAGFMRLLSPWFVDTWRDRMINIHPSLLPAFRGLNTHQRAIDAGVALHGCTVHAVRREMDEGPVLGQAALPIVEGEGADSLADRVLGLEHRLYPAALAAFASGRVRVEGERRIGTPVVLFGEA